MKIEVTVWTPGQDDIKKHIDLPLSQAVEEEIIKGNEKVIRKIFKEAIKPYTKFKNFKRPTYNALHKCVSYGGDEDTDTIAKVKFIDLAPKGIMYE